MLVALVFLALLVVGGNGFMSFIKGGSFAEGANPFNIGKSVSTAIEGADASRNFASTSFIFAVFTFLVFFLLIYSFIALIPGVWGVLFGIVVAVVATVTLGMWNWLPHILFGSTAISLTPPSNSSSTASTALTCLKEVCNT